MIYHHTDKGYEYYLDLISSCRTNRWWRSSLLSFAPTAPTQLLAVLAASHNDFSTVEQVGKPTAVLPAADDNDSVNTPTFDQQFLSQPVFLHRLFTGQLCYNAVDISSLISSSAFRIASDGSFANQIGTASCVLWDGHKSGHITFAVPGMPEDQSAYRSELAGLYCQL